MAQTTHPRIQLGTLAGSRRAVVLAGLLALVATAAVVLVLALSAGGSSQDSAAARAGPQSWPGPDESRAAAAVSDAFSASSSLPEETSIAASVAAGR